MRWFSYLFEARSIQAFLFATNRLKEVVGASELVEQLTCPGGLLDDCLEAIEGEIHFSRRGGGAFSAFSQNDASIERMASLWPLLVRQCVPDLPFHDGRGAGESAYAAFRDAYPRLLSSLQGPLVRLPSPGPLAVRCRRTGEPATAIRRAKADELPQPLDAATARKLHPRFARGAALIRRFAPEAPVEAWPLNLSPEDGEPGERGFPFTGDQRTVGLIHVDGNGLGATLATLQAAVADRSDEYVDLFATFSRAVADASERAAQLATAKILTPSRVGTVFPARPIVLGGDDLTILVRSDLALAFASEFMRAFADQTERHLQDLGKRLRVRGLPRRLTACAGIAYGAADQPFHSLHKLAEELCRHAKLRSREARRSELSEVPASVAFYRVTTSLVDDYEHALEQELTTRSEGVRFRQTLETYALEAGTALPRLDDLFDLQRILDDPNLGRSGTRELLSLVRLSPGAARRRYSRWRENLAKSASTQALLAEFDRLLQVLARVGANDFPFGPREAELQRSPLGDVVALRAVANAVGVVPRTGAARVSR